MKNAHKVVVDYSVLSNAISNAALSRRAALQIELAVGLVHFDQETEGTASAGKARLKEVYQAAGYDCMSKADRDYKTVNRRLNACAALYDKFGSSLVAGWSAGFAGDTEALLAYVVTELQPYGLETMDDVLHYVGKDSAQGRGARQSNGPKNETQAANDDGAGEGEGDTMTAPEGRIDLESLKKTLLSQYAPELLNQFCAELLEQVAAMTAAMEQKAA
jgi:hypothetical protein